MSLGNKMSQMAANLQDGVKSTSISFAGVSLKVMTAFFLGLTLALIGQEVLHYGTTGFVFMLLVVMGLLYKAMATWTISMTLVFDLICVLVALVLRMYILLAP